VKPFQKWYSLSHAPVLAFPDPDLPLKSWLMPMLLAVMRCCCRIIGRWLFTATKFREEICIGKQELLAVKKWRCHLKGAKEASAKVLALLGIDQHMSTTLHPHTDRQTNRQTNTT